MTRLFLFGAAIFASFVYSVNAADNTATQPAKPTVLVLSFVMPGNPGGAWIARAAKDDLVAGLTHGLDATVRTPTVTCDASDLATALKLGREYNANFVVYGYVQEVDNVARITGQVIDVESGMPVGGLKVTGPAVRILDIDDVLTAQALVSLPPSMLKPEALTPFRQYLRQVDANADAPSTEGLARIPPPVIDTAALASGTLSYFSLPPIVVSAGYGYAGPFAPYYFSSLYAYPVPVVGVANHHDHLPVILHGPVHPGRPEGMKNGDGVVIAGGAGTGNSTPATFSWGQNSGAISTPFMGGGQSFPAQNGFVTIGASAGFSVFNAQRFSDSNFSHGFGGRSGPGGR